MPTPFSHTQTLLNEDETSLFAQALAACLNAGDTVLLRGPVGAGKTHIARAIIQEKLAKAGEWEDVPSPTYTIVQTYTAGDLEIWHTDFYRLNSADELAEIGIYEALPKALCLIEWPEILEPPAHALHIDLAPIHDGTAREVTVSGSADWTDRLRGLSTLKKARG